MYVLNIMKNGNFLSTFVFHVKASVANRAITAKGQIYKVGCTLDFLRQFAVLETADQVAVAIRPIVDIQEVIIRLNTETGSGNTGY